MRTALLRGSIVATAALLLGTPALASERSDVELCSNYLDDDGDGRVDEEPCMACDHCVPVSTDGVVPELWYGEPTCDRIGFPDLYGFKIDATPQDGIYWFTSSYGVLDGGPEDPDNYVVISNTQYVGDNLALFDWASTLPVEAVIVKSHDDSVYVYDPPDFADGGLGTPDTAHQISHVEFCYSYALTVTKTADASFAREYTWTIDKLATPDALEGFIGDTVGTTYEVTVDRSFEDYGYTIEGEIAIYNPAAVAVGFEVADVVEGGYAALVTCPDTVIEPLETLVCTYTVEVPDAATRLNTATVTTDNLDVPGNEATALAVFGTEPDTIVGYPDVSVTDSQPDATDPWAAGDDATWTYQATFDCPPDPSQYVGGVATFDVDNTALVVETEQTATETVTVTCYAPVVSKDAFTGYTRTYTWEIDKSVVPEAFVGFAGEEFLAEYGVAVQRFEADSDFEVYGTIVVGNPHPTESMTVALSDMVGSSLALLDCDGTLVVPAAGNASCGYTAPLDAKVDGLNEAIVSFNGFTFGGTAAWTFGDPTTVVGYPEIGVTDTNEQSWSASDTASWSYTEPFACPSKPSAYVDGTYGFQHDNTATITETGQVDSETVTVTCYAPVVTKDATAEFTRTYTWEIDKQVAPAAHVGFVGEEFSSDYQVVVDRIETDDGFTVYGTIAVTNPHPAEAMSVTLTDVIPDAIVVLDCTNPVVVPAGGTATCGYTALLGARVDGTNTATATLNGAEFWATAPYVFGTEPTHFDGYDTVGVVDTNGASWSASGDATFGYSMPFACPTDPATYTGGQYATKLDNTATITETGQQDSESVTVTCYAPVVSKDANTAYTRTYTWTIDKQAAPTSHVGFPGDEFASNYEVVVERSQQDSDFTVHGTIVVGNPHPTQTMTVAISDFVGDVAATLDCGGSLVVPAAGNASCGYTAQIAAMVDGTNTATAVLNGVSFGGTAPWAFGEPTDIDGYADVDVTDDLQGALGQTVGGAGTFVYTTGFVCPTDYAAYVDGVYGETRHNTATIVQTGQSDGAFVDLTCYDPAQARVVKTTQEGPAEIGQLPFAFELYAPDGTLVETVTLTAAGEATFGAALEAIGTWTVLETVPAGWVGDTTPCTFEVAFPAAAGATFTCAFENVEKGQVSLVKYENGYPAESEWTFALYAGPEGFGTEPIETITVPYDAFTADLDPYGAYTLCELALPAGWSAEWMIDTDGDGYADTVVTPYNPDVGEDLGNRCFEFGAGTAYAVPIGDTLVFEVENTYGGEGGPRTPGYWKNWNTCSNGNQADTAYRNGGWAEGFWLLDDVLPVTWDDTRADEFVFPIDTCEEAVAILDMRDARRGVTRSSDAAYKLARNLLAFQANVTAGACLPTEPVYDGAGWQTIQGVAIEAETLLDKYDFDGAGTYFRLGEVMPKKLDPKTRDAIRAQQLALTLDLYNNGAYCGGPE